MTDTMTGQKTRPAQTPQPPEPQALADYARRVGAERRNFRRYVITETQRELYHHDRYIIRISREGEVTVREAHGGAVPDEILPTDEEQEAIKAACASAAWPTSKSANQYDVEKLLKLVGRDEVLFKFRDPHNENFVTFVQQRKFRKDEVKIDLPWSFWSDGEWRCMEPDYEQLPLFGLEQLKQHRLMTVYVHEGAKTAWFMQQVDTMKTQWWRDHAYTQCELWSNRCPWTKELKGDGFQVAHIGWPGGAPNPHRVDWEPLKRLPPYVEVIVVCDNDPAGENAASQISFALQRRLKVLRFGDDFPRKFDLSDPFPNELYQLNDEGVRVYKGPTLAHCLDPATWATTADGRLRREFVEEWYYSVKPAYFMPRFDLSRRYIEKEFNARVAPFSHKHVPNVAALLQKNLSAQADTVAYSPARQSGRINYNAQQVINVYRPSLIRPRAGDAKPWLEFVKYLIPHPDDAKEMLRWCATFIARPDIRMMYSVLLISEVTGVGKSTLAEILACLAGLHNCSFPSAELITQSIFNDWAAFKRLVVIAEIYAGHSAKTFNKLKDVATDKHIDVNEKYLKLYRIENWAHFFATSNSYSALKIDDQDRRWFVPGVTEEKKPLAYFIGFRKWLEDNGGYEIIAYWAQEYVKEHGHVLTGAHAPTSAAKRRVIEESYSEGERLILQLGMQLKARTQNTRARTQNTVVRQDKIRNWLASKKAAANPDRYGGDGRQFLESARKIAAILQHGCSLHLPKKQFEDGHGKFRVVANFAVEETVTWPGLKDLCVTPEVVEAEAAAVEPM